MMAQGVALLPHSKEAPGFAQGLGSFCVGLRLPPTAQQHHKVDWQLSSASRYECECEWLFVSPVIDMRPVKGE